MQDQSSQNDSRFTPPNFSRLHTNALRTMQPRDLHRSRAAFDQLRHARSSGTSCWKAAAGLLLVGAAIWAHAATGTRSSTEDGHRQDGHRRRPHAKAEDAQLETQTPGRCGDGRCEPPETSTSCGADCPGVTTPAQVPLALALTLTLILTLTL